MGTVAWVGQERFGGDDHQTLNQNHKGPGGGPVAEDEKTHGGVMTVTHVVCVR